ncbi:TELO2-interacting protein 1 homolog isoform X1 [Danaus plexippus]|uniref:TELO2-interacting protein 1 homolog isoform X1 n=1 Tax=Danaus plexippus TaxID=13037 RepID=UPI002AB1A32F|nr:TELO2-interacting protein 1 homolog isoform X1 [Danaus plexippus]
MQNLEQLHKMNAHLKEAFTRIKPICDMVMVNPSPEHITAFAALVGELKMEIIQELQQYMLFPFITHLQSKEMETKYEMQGLLIDSMREVLQRVCVTSFEMCMKIEMGLLSLVFEKPKPGMIADVPEELKLSVMQCLTVLMLHIDQPTRVKMLENQVPLLAQAVFVSVHLAKLEKLRSLRLAAITCLCAHTGCHPQQTDARGLVPDPAIETAVLGLLACILPGVLAALQDVAMSDNPGHAVVVAALNATHRVLCLTMHNKHLATKEKITADDFVAMLAEKAKPSNDVSKESIRDSRLGAIIAARDYHSLAEFIRSGRDQTDPPRRERKIPKQKKNRNQNANQKNVNYMERLGSYERTPNTSQNAAKAPRDIPKRTSEWYTMAGDKLAIVIKSLIPLVSHEHFKVRKELAILCYRIISECSATMQPSLPMSLDVLISLCHDSYQEVSDYCDAALKAQFSNPERETMDSLCENFFATINCLPRIMNNIDENRKLSALNLIAGYLTILCDGGRPQRLTSLLTASDGFDRVCDALIATADMYTDLSLLARPAGGDITGMSSCELSGPCPWRRLRHLSPAGSQQLQGLLASLGAAECAELLLDRFLELFHERRSCDLIYIINYLGSGPDSNPDLARRIISVYITEDVWYQPLEVQSGEKPLSADETLDESIYNPRSWTRDTVPGLFEGAIETRFTDISSTLPRVRLEPNTCVTLGHARRNLTRSCLLTEGLGLMALRLGRDYQQYLLKTLCLLLERVGSRYPPLRSSGLIALQQVAAATEASDVTDLIGRNADYFTSQVTGRLKKAWNTQSALQILSVVMEYSDVTILDYLYGIVEDVLVQSCDQYYEKNLYSYLQVFLTFINCIRKWFLIQDTVKRKESHGLEIDVLKDVIEFANNKEEVERLLNTKEFEEETGRSVEEMYQEDLQRKEEDLLDYDDTVTQEAVPLPQHVRVTITILKRCVHFVSYKSRDEALVAMEALWRGLELLRGHDDELLPLVHALWEPLAARLQAEPVLARAALRVLALVADLAGDFVRERVVKDVLPRVCSVLRSCSRRSVLADAGSSYRLTASYSLQRSALEALGPLAANVGLRGIALLDALKAGALYLHKNQPKPLQLLAVKFFKDMLEYDYGSSWQFLRRLANNKQPLTPPANRFLHLEPVVGSPYECTDPHYDNNIKLIFYVHK